MGALFTSAHSPVLPQHVPPGALALVGSKSVHAAEGTEQRVLNALIDICIGRDKDRGGRETLV